MARRISYELDVISPIHINSRRFQTFNETLEFIPATTIRGALANLICIKNGKLKCETCNIKASCYFDRIFPENVGVRFENLYPIRDDHDSKADYNLVRVLPATAVSCKRCSGFLNEYEYKLSNGKKKPYEPKPHGVFDMLIKKLSCEIKEDYNYEINCPECHSKAEPFDGFYCFLDEKVSAKTEVSKRRIIRTAINRARRSAEEEMLYSLEVMEEGSRFFGAITMEDDVLESILKYNLEKLKEVRIGAARSRGFGEISIYTIKNPDFDDKVKDRIEIFNRFLNFQNNSIYFTLDLQSDVIANNGNGEYSAYINEEMLLGQLRSFATNLDDDGLKLVRWFTSQGHFSAWSNVWKLNRDIDSTIKMGSVFVYKVDAITDELIKALEQLQIWGIGNRREEGFGKVIVCDPFHWGFCEKIEDYNPDWRL